MNDRAESIFKKFFTGCIVIGAAAGLVRCDKIKGLFKPGIDNVVLISIDTLRADHLGCYHPSVRGTPVMDSLAEEGVLFEHALCNFPKTTPSHATMLTGTYSWTHGVRGNNRRIPEEITLLPETLKSKGFATGGFVSLSTMKGVFGFDRGFDLFNDHLPSLGPPETGDRERRGMETVDAAIDWLSGHVDERFFLFLHLADPHGPYAPPEQYTKDVEPEQGDTANHLPRGRHNYVFDSIPAYQYLEGHHSAEFYKQRYMAEIRYVDDCLGAFFDKLKEWGVYDRSLIIFTSDHGEALGEHHQYFQHGSSLFNEQVKVPLMVAGPGIKNHRDTDMVRTVDIAPFILDALGIEVPEDMEGKSFLPRLKKRVPETGLVWYGDLLVRGSEVLGIEKQGMKLVTESRGNIRMLFDLEKDKGETRNLALENKELASTLEKELIDFKRSCKGLRAHRPRVTPEERKRIKRAMKALGYTGE